LTTVGRTSEAVAAVQEAAETYRRLAADEPRYSVDLALALGEVAGHLIDADNHSEAAPAAAQAVAIWREKADADPDAADELAHALRLLSVSLTHSGKLPEALERTEELLELTHGSDGDESLRLGDLGRKVSLLLDLNRATEAITPSAEAVAGWRTLADADPSSYEPYLAGALSDRAVALLDAAELTDAEATALEALQVWTGLAEELPDFQEEIQETHRTLAQIRKARDVL
jgi:tetratricopeptide (TPR) repeat protein